MAQKFLTDIELTQGLKDSSGDLGTSGQILSSTGSALNWVDNTASASVVYQDGFTGNGSTTAFTLANSIDNENKTQVYIDGVYQHKDTYSLSGTTLTFSTAPPNTSDIEVISFKTVTTDGDILTDSEFSSAGLMTTNGSGTYSITTNNSANWNTAYGWGDHGLSAQDKTDIANLSGTNTGDQDLSSYATQSYVGTQITNLVDSSPATLNTLNELAAALGDDPNFATTTANSIGLKAPLASPTFTGIITASSSSSGDYVRLYGSSGTGKWDIYGNGANLRISDNESAGILVVDTGATFAGILTVQGAGAASYGSLSLVSSDSFIRLNTTGGTTDKQKWDIRTVSASGYEALDFRTVNDANNSFSTKLSIAHSGNATFAGDVIIPEYIKHSGDTDTYIRVLPDEWVFRTGGSDRLTISNSNTYFTNTNVGIGTSSPSKKLHVYNTAAADVGLIESTQVFSTLAFKSSTNSSTVTIGIDGAGNAAMENKLSSKGLNLVTNGSTRLTILSDGKVGIGLTNPSEKLDVNGRVKWVTATGGDIYLFAGSKYYLDGGSNTYIVGESPDGDNIGFVTGGSTAMTIDENQNVGIGTTSPGRGLTIDKSNANAALEIIKNNTTNQIVYLGTGSSAGTDDPLLRMFHNGTENIRLYTTGDSWINGGNVGIGTTSPNRKLTVQSGSYSFPSGIDNNSFFTIAQNSWSGMTLLASTTTGSFIDFGDTDAGWRGRILYAHNGDYMYFSTAATERMRITSGGNVGIGTTSPVEKLEVHLGSFKIGNMKIQNANSGRIGFNRNTATGGIYDSNFSAMQINGPASGLDYLSFEAYNSSGNFISQMVYTGSGNLGIGTTSPSVNLHIASSNPKLRLQDTDGGYAEFVANNTDLIIKTDPGNAVGSSTIQFEIDGSEYMRINTAGNVGIGTTSPARPLHINGTEGVARFTSTASGNNGFEVGIGTSSQAFLWQSENSYVQFATNNTERMRVTSGGDVLMGGFAANGAISATLNGFGFTSSGTGTAVCNFSDVNEMFVFNQRDGSGTTQIDFRNGNVERGKIQWTTSGTTYNTTSDYRVKENLKDFNGLDKVSKIKVYDFDWIESKKQDYGVMAHELQEILPLAVTGEKDGKKLQGVDYSKIVPILIKSIQELKAEIETLKTQINN